jgi:hypothetical protein
MRNDHPLKNEAPQDGSEPGAGGTLVPRKSREPQIPSVEPGLIHLPPVQRGAEVMRFTASRLEDWLSPTGRLRAWLQFNVRAATIIAIPIFLIMPLVNKLLVQLAEGSNHLAAIAGDLAGIPAWLRTTAAILGVAAMIAVLKLLR